MVSIADNFLEEEDFKKLQLLMTNNEFQWYFIDFIDSYAKRNEFDTFQFEHYFFQLPEGCFSPHMAILNPILEKINPIAMWRIKANLLTRTPNIIENAFHADMQLLLSDEKIKQWTTSIYYVNTNNGYTKFETGEIVESVANRLVTFPGDLQHTGTSCTNEKIRVVINFNYFAP